MPAKKIKNQKSKIKKTSTAVKKPAVKAKSKKLETAGKITGLKLDVLDVKGKIVGKADLPKEIFGVKVNKTIMAQAIRVYLANQRRGTVSTKTRGEVKTSTRKIYRQKGTGRARHGAKSAPIFVGGGLVFGPKPRDYSLKLTKKMKKVALFSSLTAKKEDGGVKIINGLEKIEPKTKKAAEVFKNLQLNDKNRKVLIVTSDTGKNLENLYRACKNLDGVNIVGANLLNTYAVLNSKTILLMKQAIDVMKNTFIKKN